MEGHGKAAGDALGKRDLIGSAMNWRGVVDRVLLPIRQGIDAGGKFRTRPRCLL